MNSDTLIYKHGPLYLPLLLLRHQVGANMKGGMIDKAAFKIVYVAPMKALAAEVTAAFSHRLAPLGARLRRPGSRATTRV